MNDPARALLRKLLAQTERAGDRRPVLTVTPRYAPEYFASTDPETRDALRATLANAQAAGAVQLEWGRFEATQDLERIRLQDADRLAEFLGVERAGVQTARLLARLEPVLEAAPSWLRTHALQLGDRWRRGERPQGMGAEEVDEILLLYRALAAVARGQHDGLDLRRFSARSLGNSKAMERVKSRFAHVWCEVHDLDLEPDELFAELGLQKFAQPVFAKGPLLLHLGDHSLDVGSLFPFVAVSPDAVTKIQTQDAEYVLTIENLASFQRHVREIKDRGIVLYCGGFPSPAFRGFLLLLDALLPEHVPFCHWGDVDVGGLRIFERLARTLGGHSLQPHGMNAATGGRAFTDCERHALERMAQKSGTVGALAAAWCATDATASEQEVLDPSSPLAFCAGITGTESTVKGTQLK